MQSAFAFCYVYVYRIRVGALRPFAVFVLSVRNVDVENRCSILERTYILVSS